MTASYQPALVLLSYLVAVLASFAALEMAGRVSSTTDRRTMNLWLTGGAFAMGIGIWSMHFLGMLAFHLPIAVAYDPLRTAISALFAIAASAIALSVLRLGHLPSRSLLGAGTAMGLGIAGMHYTGMSAMEVTPGPRYDPLIVAISIVIAIGASIAALWLASKLRRETLVTAFGRKAGSALVMALAIAGMHYTGMAAARFAPDTFCYGDASAYSNELIASAVVITVLLTLTATLLVAVFDARLAERTAALAQSIDINTGLEARVEARTQELQASKRALQSMVDDANEARARTEAAYAELQQSAAQRTRLEDRVREQASLLDKAHDAIVVRDMDGHILYWNRGAELTYGWSADEVVGRNIDTLLHEPSQARDAQHAALFEHGEVGGRTTLRRKDGSTLIVEGHSTLVRDDEGQPKSVLSINTDITRRIAAEEQLQQAQRLETVGQLTGGVAHDFNNLLTVILGNAELLVEALAAEPELQHLAQTTCSAAQRGADLTHRLLAFARRQTLEPTAVDVCTLLVDSIKPLLGRTIGDRIRFDCDFATQVRPALVDPSQLENAIMNLCLNARDALRKRPGARIVVHVDEAHIGVHDARALATGNYVRITVSDNGCGIPRENVARVFEPFFTTKDFGKGTGLGLSTVYGFVKQSHGHIELHSEPDQGTSVTMLLPAVDRTPASRAGDADAALEPHGSETVLLVEDEDLLRNFAKNQLGELGYHVIAVDSGEAALQVMRRERSVDLLFTDIVMPGGLNGVDVVRAARHLDPRLRVLYTSGYADNAMLGTTEFDASAPILHKPYRRAELARKIRSALDARGSA
ncbi:MHYT domain-containing protein [Solimonas marina]|uniref:histidine kinase n=1 Tax=Solimonas marina TaxID=2714601 RepID=A0A969WDU3_9GAMM|nr:MHYT domain-containing protein [Solimonas marina]NKF22965.1 PAS domain S-box protein [Solimonas marina]